MTEYNKVFVDSAPLIYFLEDYPTLGEKTKAVFNEVLTAEKTLVTSAATCEKYLVHPYKMDDPESEQAFFDFIEDCNMPVLPITAGVAKIAAQLRAKYQAIKGMDALSLPAQSTAGATCS